MSEADEPKKQLETARGGSGRKGKTAIGAGDGGEFHNFDPRGGADEPAETEGRKAILCDRKPLIRDGWKAMLEPLVDVVGETNSGASAINLVRESRPDLVLLDVNLDDVSGLDVATRFARDVPIIAATDYYHSTKFFHRLTRSGVIAIILKSSGPSALFDAIRFGAKDNPHIDPKIEALARQHPANMHGKLLPREVEVLIRLDLRNVDIADELQMKVRTVEKHIECILAKLRVPTRTAAALKAVQAGCTLLPATVPWLPDEEDQAERHAKQAIERRRNSN